MNAPVQTETLPPPSGVGEFEFEMLDSINAGGPIDEPNDCGGCGGCGGCGT